jgi:hypothetical protein
MAVRLTTSEVDLLKELKAAGRYGRRIAGASSAEIAHLIGAQYVKRLAGMKLYTITPRGQKALAEATAWAKMTPTARRFPPSWSIEDTGAAFVIKDGGGRHFGRGSLLLRKALRVSAHTPRVSRTA